MTDTSTLKPRLLKLVDYHSPVLRQIMKPIQFPLSNEDKELIRDMKYSIQAEQLKEADAPWDAAVGMAANQWGIHKRIFLFCPDADTINGLEAIINPSYEPILETTIDQEAETWEGCFSVPLATGIVKRYTHIRVTYQNELGETIVKELRDWPARVWQHENDHLDGLLYDDEGAGKCHDKRVFLTREAVDEFYKQLKDDRI
jgi:peptide deformylase